MLFASLVVLIGIAYTIIIVLLIIGWQKLTPISSISPQKHIKISVIIATRNEEKNILNLLNDLQLQTYPNSCYEIIITDDHSTDNTYNKIYTHKKKYKNVTLLKLSQSQKGKKEAIINGVQYTKNELIVTTDADCRVGKFWLQNFCSIYSEKKPSMIVAPIYLVGGNFLSWFQTIEFAGILVSTGGAIGLGRPITCNAANLGFKRETFIKLNNPLKKEIQSGDDIFLLHSVKEKNRKKITFLKSTTAIVQTQACSNLKTFLHQRVRWASKVKFYQDKDSLLVGSVVSVMNLKLMFLLVLSIFFPICLSYFGLLFAIKCIIDFMLLWSGIKFLQINKRLLLFFPVFQFIYVFYVCLILFLNSFNTYHWRGRIVKV